MTILGISKVDDAKIKFSEMFANQKYDYALESEDVAIWEDIHSFQQDLNDGLCNLKENNYYFLK